MHTGAQVQLTSGAHGCTSGARRARKFIQPGVRGLTRAGARGQVHEGRCTRAGAREQVHEGSYTRAGARELPDVCVKLVTFGNLFTFFNMYILLNI